MSLGLTIISAFSGMITAMGLYFGGHVSLIEGLGAYTVTGVLVALIAASALILDGSKAENRF